MSGNSSLSLAREVNDLVIHRELLCAGFRNVIVKQLLDFKCLLQCILSGGECLRELVGGLRAKFGTCELEFGSC